MNADAQRRGVGPRYPAGSSSVADDDDSPAAAIAIARKRLRGHFRAAELVGRDAKRIDAGWA